MAGWMSMTTGGNSSGDVWIITKARRLWGSSVAHHSYLYLINAEFNDPD